MEHIDLEQSLKCTASGGHVLNCQELAGLTASLTLMKRQEKYSSICFWGKVFGVSGDYYVAYALKEPVFEFPAKVFYYAGEDFEFKPLPVLTVENAEKVLALALDKPFTGKPDTVIEPEVEGGEEEPPAEEEGAEPVEKPPKLTEADRLALAIQDIDFDTAVVPKGAYALNEAHVVVPSSDFKGLGATEATGLAKYAHFRPPSSIASLRALARTDAEFYSSFLDPLEADLPKGCWAVRQDPSATLVTLRSLVWPGYSAFHVPGTSKFGGAYFGYATKCNDLAFML